jgi:hypothetical protein
MKKITFLIIALSMSIASYTQEKTTTDFDESLAKELGADDYGMRKYVIAFLKKGPNRTIDSIKAVALQKGHMANIGRLSKEGKLAIAGPLP